MSLLSHSTTTSTRLRSVAIATLMGATILGGLLTAANADTGGTMPLQMAQAAPATISPNPAATDAKGETVEQRITSLHAALKITPDQLTLWNGVAQAMRENAANMDKLVAGTRTTPPQTMTAVDDLKAYQKFAQAHVDGLKNLISAFEKLYAAMPDAQKKIADTVFTAPAPVASRG